MLNEQVHSAAAAGTFTIGGDLRVNRLGYGAMRIMVQVFGDLQLTKTPHLRSYPTQLRRSQPGVSPTLRVTGTPLFLRSAPLEHFHKWCRRGNGSLRRRSAIAN